MDWIEQMIFSVSESFKDVKREVIYRYVGKTEFWRINFERFDSQINKIIKNLYMYHTTRYCFSCDLKDDPGLMAQYKAYHSPEKHWPGIAQSIKDSGIVDMEIYLVGNRMFMIMEVDESFSFERKAEMDATNPQVQEWEELMSTFQQQLPWAKKGEKWMDTELIFKLR